MSATRRRALYLDELGGLLHALDPLERIEAVDAVRTELDARIAALGPDPGEADVDTVIAALGSPADVAARVEAGEPAVPGARVEEPAQASAPVAESVAPAEAPVGAGAAADAATAPSASPAEPVAAADAPVPSADRWRSGLADLAAIPAMEWPEDAPPRPGLTRRWLPPLVVGLIFLGALFSVFLLPLLVMGIGMLLLWLSPLWDARQKLVGTVVPALGAVSVVVSLLTLSPGGGVGPVAILVPLFGLAALVVLVWLAVRGVRQVAVVDAEYPPPAKRR